MPIAAPIANVMATIWKGGIGPARTDRVASAPHSAMAPSPAAIARRRSAGTVVTPVIPRRIDNPVACVDRAGYDGAPQGKACFIARPILPAIVSRALDRK